MECVFLPTLQVSSETSHCKKNRAIYNYKSIVVFAQNVRYSRWILMNLEFFFDRFSKSSLLLLSMNIRPVGAELFHADGQTDMKPILFFSRNFAKRQYSICWTGNLFNRKVNCMLRVPIAISYSFSSTSRCGNTSCSTSSLLLTATEILSLTFIVRLVQEILDITIVCPNPCQLTVHDHFSFSFNI